MTSETAGPSVSPPDARIEPRPARVLIADDHFIVRKGIAVSLPARDFEIVGEAEDGEQAVLLARELKPDIVLTDLMMPNLNGLEATTLIKRERPETIVLILTGYAERDFAKKALLAGASGYILKGSSPKVLLNALDTVMEGGSLIDGSLLRAFLGEIGGSTQPADSPHRLGLEELTSRERQVLEIMATGATNKEIADQMHYSVGTVKNVVQRVIEKLQASDRTQAAVLAVQAGLVSQGRTGSA